MLFAYGAIETADNESDMKRRATPDPDRPLTTVGTAIAAECIVDALCLDCDHIRRLDLPAPTARGMQDTPLIRLPLRCRCGSRRCRVIVSGRPYRA